MEIQRDREEKESQIKVLKKEKDECQSQLAKMEQQIEELQKVNARLKEENNEIQTKFKKLQETLAKEHQINQQNNQNLHDEFNTQKQKIEEEVRL
jgi:peptidoglycan hydrolase CwlO-like protein